MALGRFLVLMIRNFTGSHFVNEWPIWKNRGVVLILCRLEEINNLSVILITESMHSTPSNQQQKESTMVSLGRPELNGASSFSVCVNGAGHKGGSEQWQVAPSVDQADLQVAENWFDWIKRVRTSQYWPWNEFCHLGLLNYMVQSSYLTCQRAKHYRRQQLSSTSGWCGC